MCTYCITQHNSEQSENQQSISGSIYSTAFPYGETKQTLLWWFYWQYDPANLSAWAWTSATKKRDAAGQFGRTSLTTTIGLFIRTRQRWSWGRHAEGSFKIIFVVSNVVSPHGIFAAPLTLIRMSMCFFHTAHVLDFPSVLNFAETLLTDFKRGGGGVHTGRNFWLIEIMNSPVCRR